MKRILLQSMMLIAGIVVGSAAGGFLTFHKYAKDYATVRAFAWTTIFSAVSVNEYDKNSIDAKGELLFALNSYAQGLRSSALDPTMKNALRMNCGLTEARLSVIENEAGNVDGAKTYLSKAQEDLKAVGWLDRSDANVLGAVKRQPPSPCGPIPQSAAKTVASKARNACS